MQNSTQDPLFDSIPAIVIGCWASILIFVLVLLVNPLVFASSENSSYRVRRGIHRNTPVVPEIHAAAPCVAAK